MLKDREGLCFFLGVAVGAAAGVLFAPRSGRDTVEYVRRKAEEKAGAIKENFETAGQSLRDTVERGKQTLRHRAENLESAVEAGKRAYQEAVESTP